MITDQMNQLEVPEAKALQLAEIPQGTYRFQFNQHFTFQNAIALIPYLKKLGITHCYASPLFKARPGSLHGYDIIDHSQLNPEIGSKEDFEQFVEALHSNGLGLIVDIVPNHMGIGSDNHWWMDVLENGPMSEYAYYFDIDWSPLKDELYAKVLLPVLGEQYGIILENGEIQLQFNPHAGQLTLHYYEHFWPVSPTSYPQVLKYRLDILIARLGENSIPVLEYQSIIRELEHLPSYLNPQLEDVTLYQQEKRIALKRLENLCNQSPEIEVFLAENLVAFNHAKDNLHELLEMQHYRLAYWRVASDEINYRRFFDVNDLAALNMEYPQVFYETHRYILSLAQEGKISGFRIDHPDGLYDPALYFQQVQEEIWKFKNADVEPFTADPKRLPFYVVVEKILAAYERLPETWQVHGTTGYKFSNILNGLFINTAHEEKFTRIYQEFTGQVESYLDLVYRCKKLIMKTSLSSELNMLSHQLNRLSEKNWRTRDYTLNNIRRALLEVVACFPVYRTYVTHDSVSKKDQEYIEWATAAAKKRTPLLEPSIFDFIRNTLLMQNTGEEDKYFAMKFQQFTGPVMAKGVEDTCFYRYNRLVSMNEVGGELQHFGTSVAAFHYHNQERVKAFPHAMVNTSTHDSKRSEDIRARINVLSEMPEVWEKQLDYWCRMNRPKKTDIDDMLAPDANDEYFIYQTLLGVWPFGDVDMENLCSRVEDYVLKAARESKVHTSWINQNVAYEEALQKFIRALLNTKTGNPFLEDFILFQQQVAYWGMLNALSQTLLKYTVPGVPDLYQGNEIWDFSLVDPDNRRPIDYGYRENLLNQLTSPVLKSLLSDYKSGSLKLWVTATCLSLRKTYPDVFDDGEYVPLEVTGERAEHVIAFLRRSQEKTILIVAPRCLYGLTHRHTRLPVGKVIWKDTEIVLNANAEPSDLKNIFTHETVQTQAGKVMLADLLKIFPVGVFEISNHPAE